MKPQTLNPRPMSAASGNAFLEPRFGAKGNGTGWRHPVVPSVKLQRETEAKTPRRISAQVSASPGARCRFASASEARKGILAHHKILTKSYSTMFVSG